MRRRSFLALVVALLALATPLRAAEWLLSFETVPSEGEPALYTERATTTTLLISELGPPVLGVVGLDPGAFDAEIVPGGFQLKTNPSVLLVVDGDAAVADRAAAAFGYVFDQSSVLVWREAPAGSVVAVVTLPAVTPNLADHFFRHAASVHPGLGGGYTARGNRLMFINLRGSDGQPFSGLSDEEFLAAMSRAAANFGGLAAATSARVEARLVERESYVTLIGPAQPALDRLRVRRLELTGRR
jgi:hypothetical protein